jgi:hypothetical protein
MRFSLLFAVGLLAAGLPHRTSAQSPCPPKGIETDPLPVGNATNPGGTPNTFNWYYGNYQPSTYNGTLYQLNSAVDPTPYLELPWQQANNTNMVRFQGKNDISTNGWQLIRRDLGYDEAGNPLVTSNPFVILYNKYLGVLRVFVTIQRPLTNFQFAEVKLKFSPAGGYKAATLNRAAVIGVPLEETEAGTGTQFAVVARYLNDSRKWLVADFPMDYDPCVCQFDSRLEINVNLIKQATVNLKGISTGTLTTTTDPNAGTGDGPSFFKTVGGAIKAAGTAYDNVDKLSGKLKAEGTATPIVDSFITAIKGNKFLQGGIASVPYLGAAVGLLDFFTGGGQDSAPQPLALQPLAIQMSTLTTGTIKDTSLYVTPYFFNPGNRLAQTRPADVPNYNETLGVFSLLKRPEVEYKVVTTNDYSDRSTTTTRSFRLASPLQYALNPAAGLTVQDFQVALVLNGTNKVAPTKSFSPGMPPTGSFETLEGPLIQADGTLTYSYRNAYSDAACFTNNVYESYEYRKDNSTYFGFREAYLKVMLNLKPTRNSATQQNVLLVIRYPVTLTSVSSFSTRTQAACGVLPQASTAAIQAICSGSKYTTAIKLSRGGRVATPVVTVTDGSVSKSPQISNSSLTAYPNPATGSVRFKFATTRSGHVRIFLSDALGRQVRQILDTDNAAAGASETTASVADLRPGIYYCTLQLPGGERIVQKLVVAP